VAPPVDPSD